MRLQVSFVIVMLVFLVMYCGFFAIQKSYASQVDALHHELGQAAATLRATRASAGKVAAAEKDDRRKLSRLKTELDTEKRAKTELQSQLQGERANSKRLGDQMEDYKLDAGATSETAQGLEAANAELAEASRQAQAQLRAMEGQVQRAQQATAAAAAAERGGLLSVVHSPQERQPALRKPTADRPTSSAHVCSGQIFQGREWMGKSCYYRNLCYDTADKQFVYYAGGDEVLGPSFEDADARNDDGEPGYYFWPAGYRPDVHKDMQNGGSMTGDGGARGYMPMDMTVSLAPYNSVLSAHDAGKPSTNGMKWAPEVRHGPIPPDAHFDTSASVFILHMSYIASNIGHFMFDEMLPWYTLMRMFNLVVTDAQPLSYYIPEPSRLSCDYSHQFIREHASEAPEKGCKDWYVDYQTKTTTDEFKALPNPEQIPFFEKWQGQMPKGCNLNVVEMYVFHERMHDTCNDVSSKFGKMVTTKEVRHFPDFFKKPEPKLVCYPRLLAGVGFLAEHCQDGSFHGDLPNGESNCNNGRGPQYYEFRNFAMGNAGLSGVPPPCAAGAAYKAGVLLALRGRSWHGYTDHKFNEAGNTHWLKAADQFREDTDLNVTATVIAGLSLREQMQLYAETTVALQLSGGSSSTAIFLPRGATLIHLAPRVVKDDYQLWARVSHITVDWYEIEDHSALFDTQEVLGLVKQAARRYTQFNDCAA